ncbi:MAG: DUF1223 domain-containing protein [Luteimonas sp.]
MSFKRVLLVIGVVFASQAAAAADSCSARSGATAVPLVEMYTSEGCSSCPPADRWLSKQVSSQKDSNWLAFHVDYWDDIGWPDRFASASYSQRQRQRVNALGGSTVYTPQVMVGDAVNAPWRADGKFTGTLADQRMPAAAGLALRLEPVAGGSRVQIGAARSGDATAPAQVWLAQYVDDQTTQVRAGENRGETLHHDRVVRHLYGPWKLDGTPLSQAQALPATAGSWGLVAFVQDARGRTLQSLALPASTCVASVQ